MTKELTPQEEVDNVSELLKTKHDHFRDMLKAVIVAPAVEAGNMTQDTADALLGKRTIPVAEFSSRTKAFIKEVSERTRPNFDAGVEAVDKAAGFGLCFRCADNIAIMHTNFDGEDICRECAEDLLGTPLRIYLKKEGRQS